MACPGVWVCVKRAGAMQANTCTVDGTTRQNDNDYLTQTGTLTFAPGETSKTITIEVKGDSKREANPGAPGFYLDLFGNSTDASV